MVRCLEDSSGGRGCGGGRPVTNEARCDLCAGDWCSCLLIALISYLSGDINRSLGTAKRVPAAAVGDVGDVSLGPLEGLDEVRIRVRLAQRDRSTLGAAPRRHSPTLATRVARPCDTAVRKLAELS